MEEKQQEYQKNCLLGAVGAALLIAGDLCLSVVSANKADSGLYMRESYLSGEYPLNRIVILLVTGLIGMFFYAFGIKAIYQQIRPECKILRACIKYGGLGYVVSGATLHFLVGTFAYWITYLSAHIGREQAILFVDDYYNRFMTAIYFVYIPMIVLMLASLIAVLRNKTNMSRWMVIFHIVVWQLIFAGIPDILQVAGAGLSTIGYVCSQASGNTAALIWFLASYIWVKIGKTKKEFIHK